MKLKTNATVLFVICVYALFAFYTSKDYPTMKAEALYPSVGEIDHAEESPPAVGKQTENIVNTTDFMFKDNDETGTYFILQPDVDCSDEDLFLIYVYSAPENHQRRTLVRQTWGNLTHYAGYRQFQFRLFFVLGWRRDDELRNQIQLESSVYGDLLVADFIDSYFNLTLKGLSALRWIRSSCPLKNIKYVFKTDDDVFVNLFAVLQHIERATGTWHFLCNINRNKSVKREGKWAIRRDRYPQDTYPNYCSGAGYVMTADALALLLGSCFKVPPYPIEDFFFSSFCIRSVFPDVAIRYRPFTKRLCRLETESVQSLLAMRHTEGAARLILAHPLPTKLWTEVLEILEDANKRR